VLRLLQTSDTISLYNATSGLTKRVYAELGKKFGLDASIQQQLAALEELSATDIEEQLSVFFAVDLYRHIVIESLDRCVLFFDTYELLWENGQGDANKLHNDAWVRKMASMTMLNNVIFVLSGREKLLWELESETWSDKIQLVALDVLAPEFAVRYLDICEIIDREIQDSIVAASQGHPYYLDLCVDTYYKLINAHKPVNPDSFGKGFQEIQERFFRSLGANEVTMLNVLSVPRFYDFEIFESLASRFNKSYSTANFKSFNAFSFIKHEVSGKYIIHILMRDEIKKHMDTDLKRSINAAMIKYFNEKLSPERIAVEDVRYYFAELLFHLEAAESRGKLLERVENEFIGIIKRLQLSGETNYLLEQFSDVFNESRNVLGGTEFFAVMADMIHLSGRYREAVEIITDYLDRFRIDEIARDGYCLNLYIRRTHHQMFYTPLQILNGDLNKIIDLIDREKDIPQYCEILFMLGAHIYLPMGDFDKACDYLRRMNKIAKKHGLYGLLCRGLRKFAEVLCARKNYVSAEKVCLVGLRIARAESMWRYEFYLRCILGEVKRLSGNTEEAMAIFEEAVPTAESLGIKGWIGHVDLALGNCYTDLGNFAKAFECYDIARKFYGDIGQKWGEVNLETAYQRTLLLSDGKADENELIRLKQECDELGYKVLTNKIDGLLDGNREIIRFEYL
jgi:tetratricopeptide (TPR) repeat protein